MLERAGARPTPSPDAAMMRAMVSGASDRKTDALALRDRMVASAGEGAAELAAKMNEAITGAEKELESIAREEAAAGEAREPANESP